MSDGGEKSCRCVSPLSGWNYCIVPVTALLIVKYSELKLCAYSYTWAKMASLITATIAALTRDEPRYASIHEEESLTLIETHQSCCGHPPKAMVVVALVNFDYLRLLLKIYIDIYRLKSRLLGHCRGWAASHLKKNVKLRMWITIMHFVLTCGKVGQ